MFTNTKFDLGACPKQHSDIQKSDYQRSVAEGKDFGFEWDYMRDLQKHVDDCNRKIDGAERRLDKTPDEAMKMQELIQGMAETEERISLLLDEIEVLGALSSVARALDQYHTVQNLKIDRAERQRELRSMTDVSGASTTNQKLQVCDVCSAYLSKLDNDRRLADHFGGKMHMGFSRMRQDLAALQHKLAGRRPPSLQQLQAQFGELGPKSDDRERDRDYGRSGGGPVGREAYRRRGGGGGGGGGGYRSSRF